MLPSFRILSSGTGYARSPEYHHGSSAVGMNERIAQSGQRLNVTAPDVFDPEAFPANAHKEPVHLPLGKLPCQLELSVRTADEHDPPLLSRKQALIRPSTEALMLSINCFSSSLFMALPSSYLYFITATGMASQTNQTRFRSRQLHVQQPHAPSPPAPLQRPLQMMGLQLLKIYLAVPPGYALQAFFGDQVIQEANGARFVFTFLEMRVTVQPEIEGPDKVG